MCIFALLSHDCMRMLFCTHSSRRAAEKLRQKLERDARAVEVQTYSTPEEARYELPYSFCSGSRLPPLARYSVPVICPAVMRFAHSSSLSISNPTTRGRSGVCHPTSYLPCAPAPKSSHFLFSRSSVCCRCSPLTRASKRPKPWLSKSSTSRYASGSGAAPNSRC
jgi:hypothetical protein